LRDAGATAGSVVAQRSHPITEPQQQQQQQQQSAVNLN